jgi:predicted phage terminase large subunit-like protein
MKNLMEMLTPESLKQRTRETLLRSFSAFCRAAWPTIEPKGLSWGWHHELWCEHLQLAYERQELRLIFTTPPRTLKSRLISVLWPCWCWAKDPSLSFLCTSYSDSLSEELSLLRRSLLQSAWFQELFPNTVLFNPDQNQKWKYQNTARGQMFATSMAGTALGAGCDFLIVDDPLSSEMSYSDAERGNVNRAFDATFRSRLNESERGGIVIICQRLHEVDLVGHLLANEPGVWRHISLPMVAEQDEEVVFPLSGRVLERKAGDLLHPAKFSRKWCQKQQAVLGSYLWSSQYLQRPGPLGGAIFKSDWFREYTNLPESKPGMSVLSLDTAFSTKKSADYSVASAWTMYEGRFYLRYVWRDRCEYPKLKAMVQALCEDLRPEVVLVEEKGSGQSLLQSLKEETSLPVVGVTPDTDKVSRAHGVSALFESGRVFFPKDEPWMPTFKHELELFPSSAHDDQVDSMTQALIYLRSRGYDGGILGVVKWIKKKATLGAEPYKAPAAVLTGALGQVVSIRDKPAKCPLCGGPRIWMAHGMDANRLVAFCNQDGSKDGILPVATDNHHCPNHPDGHFYRIEGGVERCKHCGDQEHHRDEQAYNGATKAQTEALKEQTRNPAFGIRRRWGQKWGI